MISWYNTSTAIMPVTNNALTGSNKEPNHGKTEH